MPRYIKYPLLALAIGAAIWLVSDRPAPASAPVEAAATGSQPNYLITDASIRPPQ